MKISADQFTLFDTAPETAALTVVDPSATNGNGTVRRKKEPDPPPLPAITGTPEGQSFTEFFLEHRRVPMIQDERKPWTFRGWLFWYRMLAEDYDITPPRWNYWARTMQAGKLLNEPIPRIEFECDESERSEGFKHIDKLVQILAHHLRDFERINPLLEWLLFGFGLSKELPDFPPELHEALYRTFNMEIFLRKPCDYFAAWIQAHKGRWNPTGFFATPHNVVEMMTRMIYGEGDHRAARVHEPCLGTGRMLLHASNYSLRLSGQDIDHTVILAAKVNGALYAPWLVRPFPEEIFTQQ